MLEIRLLGGFELAPTDGSPPGRLGPKSQGLLAVLAMSRGQLLTRSRLAGLLWGERDEDLARHSLSQALTTIRTALGPTASDIVVAEPEGVALAKDRLKLDVDDFETAVRIGRPRHVGRCFPPLPRRIPRGARGPRAGLRGLDAERAISARRGGGGRFCPAARSPDYRGRRGRGRRDRPQARGVDAPRRKGARPPDPALWIAGTAWVGRGALHSML